MSGWPRPRSALQCGAAQPVQTGNSHTGQLVVHISRQTVHACVDECTSETAGIDNAKVCVEDGDEAEEEEEKDVGAVAADEEVDEVWDEDATDEGEGRDNDEEEAADGKAVEVDAGTVAANDEVDEACEEEEDVADEGEDRDTDEEEAAEEKAVEMDVGAVAADEERDGEEMEEDECDDEADDSGKVRRAANPHWLAWSSCEIRV